MSTKSIALILGAGSNVGSNVAKTFASKGYKVAIVSRKGTGSQDSEGILSLKADFADPSTIPALFKAVKAEFGNAPTTVIYNAAALTPPAVKDSPLSIPVAGVASDLNINVVSPYAAAQQAVVEWETLPKEVKKTFIYTGNCLNVQLLPVPIFTNLGMGKAASAFWIGVADKNYSAQGYRFFYADQRQPNGDNVANGVDGPAHAEFFAHLAEGSQPDIPWHATFVKDQGYTKF